MRLLFLLLILVAPALQAHAHSSHSASYNAIGLAIPSMTHGALDVLDDHYAAIVGIADQAKESDPVFRKLKNYTRIQYYYCLWGIAPRAISDEASPFNECSHAYLSGARSLLLHMRQMPSVTEAAGRLASAIDIEMVHRGTALVLCSYSAAPFFTGAFVTPHWENVTTHSPTLVAAVCFFALVAGVLFTGVFWSRSSRLRFEI
ncbi:hypothetical protein ACQKGL_28230 [Ensifer adhaerens]|uniref:hypothetical protein n=1 Tax=Ensifer adhaerens TaxID=106592 RepID=UPI003D0680A8